MAVGKGSVERAAKAKVTEKKAGTEVKAPKTAETVAAAGTIAAPDGKVLQEIVYQPSSGMLDRDAEPNERFGLGDAMPVYYF